MSQAGVSFTDEPWGFLLSAGKTRTGAESQVDGAGSPRLFTALDSKPPRWVDGAGLAPKAGLAFRWQGRDYQAWHVPCSNAAREDQHDLELRWSVDHVDANTLTQRGLLHRPPDGAEDLPAEALHLDALINWMVHSFQELGHMELEIGRAHV
jgi:hypothetical protein